QANRTAASTTNRSSRRGPPKPQPCSRQSVHSLRCAVPLTFFRFGQEQAVLAINRQPLPGSEKPPRGTSIAGNSRHSRGAFISRQHSLGISQIARGAMLGEQTF